MANQTTPAIQIKDSNVGIGTTSPSSPFTVATDVRAASLNAADLRPQSQVNLLGGGGDSLFIGQLTNSFAYIQSSYFNTTLATYPILLNPLGGNVLIGTTTDNGNKLRVQGTTWISGNVYTNGEQGVELAWTGNTINDNRIGRIRPISTSSQNPYAGGLAFDYYKYDGAAYNFFEGMRLNGSGNVGIGTNNPEQKLHVQGSGLMATLQNSSTAADGYTQLEFKAGDRYGYIWLGNQNATSWAGAGGLNIYTSNGNMDLWTGAAQRIRIMNAGNVLIGTTTDAGYKLDVNGTFRSQGVVNIQNGYYENEQLNVGIGETKYLYVDITNTSGNVEVLVGGYGGAGSASCLISWIDGGHGAGTPYHRLIQIARQTQGNPVLGNVIQTAAGGAISIQNTGGSAIALWVTTRSYGSNSVAANAYLSDTAPTGNNASILNVDDINSRVGIGTTSPGVTLDVNGPGRFVSDGASRVLYLKQDGNNSGNIVQFLDENAAEIWEITGRDNQFYIYNNAIGYSLAINPSTNNISIGTTTDAGYKLYVNGTGFFNNVLRASAANTFPIRAIATSGGVSRISFEDNVNQANDAVWVGSEGYNLCFGSNFSEQARISSSGNLIIGSTTDAGYKLDVYGEILGRDDIRILNTYALILNGTDANWRIGRNTITDSGWLTGNTMQMVVFGGQTGQGFQVVNTNGTALFEIDGVAGASRFTNALGVGVNPSGTAGRIDASNDIVAYSTSDQRLKENITPIANALDKVKALTGVEFDWKEDTKAVHGYEGHDVGVIAQEVQAVLPEAVRTNDSGYLSVRYEKMIALLVEANKELASRIEELEKKLK